MRPVIALLRGKGLVSNIYLNDLLLIGDTVRACQINIGKTMNLLQKLGFIINYQKSVLNASQTITYLGFCYDDTEFQLNNRCFLEITEKFGVPDIDLFASRTNRKCKVFAPWHKDPESA